MESTFVIDADVFVEKLASGQPLAIIDVREPDEFEDWAIPGAINIPLGQVAERRGEIPTGELIVVCARGSRAQQAADILRDAGLHPEVLEDGMAGWARAYDVASQNFGDIEVVQLRRRGKGCLSYLVGSVDQCVVIDPPLDIERVIELAALRGWKIICVVDTHLHADHVSGASLLASACGAQHLVNRADGGARGSGALEDGQAIHFASSQLKVMFTPGHTRGSTTFVLDDQALFTGDVLMIESVGRPDLADQADAFAHQLYQSLLSLKAFGDDAIVLPAHYGPTVPVEFGVMIQTSIGQLRASQAALSDDEETFVAWACAAVTLRPPSYQKIVALNMAEADPDRSEAAELEVGPNRCAVSTPH